MSEPRRWPAEVGLPTRPEPESPSALPSRARAGAELAVDIAAERLPGGLTGYTVRLRERDGRPVTDATVSIRGRRADGAVVDATLDRGEDPGVYRAMVRLTGEIHDARLRVSGAGRVQEVPLPEPPR